MARVASEHGHDSFVMLNVYPQRSTDPRGLHTTVEPDLRDANERHIAALVRGRRLTIWAAWGTNIVTRSYLSPCLRGLLALPELAQCVWVSRGPTSKAGHPHHPLYVSSDSPLESFDMQGYLAAMGTTTRRLARRGDRTQTASGVAK